MLNNFGFLSEKMIKVIFVILTVSISIIEVLVEMPVAAFIDWKKVFAYFLRRKFSFQLN